MTTKTCRSCRNTMPMDCFYKNNQRPDGRTADCRDCKAVSRKGYDRKYNQTIKAKATALRYYRSRNGQLVKKLYRTFYKPTEEQQTRYRIAARKHEKETKYKVRRKRYDQSAKGKAKKAARDKRHVKTEKGRFSKRRVEIKRKHQLK